MRDDLLLRDPRDLLPPFSSAAVAAVAAAAARFAAAAVVVVGAREDGRQTYFRWKLALRFYDPSPVSFRKA